MKKTLLVLLASLAASLSSHEGHKEAGTFEPPHGGAFTRLADHWVELYTDGPNLKLCMYEPDGGLTVDQHAPVKISLSVTPKGGKKTVLKAEKTVNGCVSWSFISKAKLLRAELSALVDGKPAKAKLALELKGNTANKAASAKYVCSMDGYSSDKPGKCAKCGMDLIAVK